MEFLPQLLLPSRLASIKLFKFVWNAQGTPVFKADVTEGLQKRIWMRLWSNIAAMKGLCELHIVLVIGNAYPGACDRDWNHVPEPVLTEILEPLSHLKASERFVLTIPDTVDVKRAPWQNLPCTISQPSMSELFSRIDRMDTREAFGPM